MAAVTIPIIDIGPTPGPLSIWRYLAIQAGTNPLLLGLIQKAGNTYNLPGLDTLFDSNTTILAEADRQSPASTSTSACHSTQGRKGTWELLGGSRAVRPKSTDSRNIHFRALTRRHRRHRCRPVRHPGDSTYDRNLKFLGSALNSSGDRTVGDFNGELALAAMGRVQGRWRRSRTARRSRRAHGNPDRHEPSHHVQSGLADWLSREQRDARRWRRSLPGVRQGELRREHRVPRQSVHASDGRLDARGRTSISGDFSTNRVAVDAGDWSVLRHGRGRRHVHGRRP